MGRIGITYLDVSNAIANIQGRQKNPTVDAIREELGTGSRSTIAKYFLEWKTKSGARNTTETGIPIELQNLIQSLWEKIQSDANTTIEKHQLESNTEILEAKNTASLTQQQNTLLQHDIKNISEKLDSQIQTSEQLKNTINQCENEEAKLLERISMLESQNQNHQNENNRLHQLLKNTQENLTHYQNSIQQQRQEQILELEKIRHESEIKIDNFQSQLAKLLQEKTRFETHCAHLENENKKLTSDNEKLQQQKNNLEIGYQQLIIAKTQLEQSNSDMIHKYEIGVHELQSHQNQLSEIKIMRATAENKITMLENQLKKSELHCIDLQNQFKAMLSEKLRLENKIAQHSGISD